MLLKTSIAFACALLVGCGARSELSAPSTRGGSTSSSGSLPSYCADVGNVSVFVVTDASNVYTFDPPSGAFALVNQLACSQTSQPETMAVDHTGSAYVTYQDGTMYSVDLKTFACTQTAFSDGPNNGRFGSCFAVSSSGTGETLYLADSTASMNGDLLTVDTQSFAITDVGMISDSLGGLELTGTGDGRLYAFGATSASTGGPVLAELERSDGAVLSETSVPIPVASGFAFSFWGGAFYFFTGDLEGDSSVSRLVPGGSLEPGYATLPGENIVGAGVSTCAPLE